MIKDNIKNINDIIKHTCENSGRDENAAKLIAVSKTKPIELIQEAYDCGMRDFGENKVQEIVDKYPVLPKDIRWHLIGHLQRNKVKYIIDKVYMIHSVDSVRLAEQIQKEAEKADVHMDILIQVNISNEDTKFGLNENEVCSIIEEVSKFDRVHIKGLMTIGPMTDNEEDIRLVFKKLKQLSVDIQAKNIDNVSMGVLSMGMSGDYTIAIEEGSTYVRVGTSIFGERNYSK
ncbi:MAG: YggS family pyridoxal phosphate-dependent enzyme [Lachnospiraceae bacterium]|nr:YggS family pyridoxal phosphate-dependent enzyme [Lachnospiraceae bacterium]MBQ4068969.1 YggS family pyridoxal phosphate-dependent enzyme [Lachnospiraceae bacterium]